MEFLQVKGVVTDQRKGLIRHIEVALWLREFRYSSPAALGQLVGIEGPYNGQLWHFLNNMKRKGIIQDFSNELAPKIGRLFMAGQGMAAFLELHGQEHTGIVTNPVYVRRCKTAFHDLNLQLACLELRVGGKERVAKVESEGQFQMSGGGWLKPDVVITSAAGKRVAIEYEMTRKADARVYHTFAAHLHAIAGGAYAGVKYLFPNDRLKDTYVRLYEESAWPNTHRGKEGRVYVQGEAYDPALLLGQDKDRRRFIGFTEACYLPPV